MAKLDNIYYTVVDEKGYLQCGSNSSTNGLYESPTKAMISTKKDIKRCELSIYHLQRILDGYEPHYYKDPVRGMEQMKILQEDNRSRLATLLQYRPVKVKIVIVED